MENSQLKQLALLDLSILNFGLIRACRREDAPLRVGSCAVLQGFPARASNFGSEPPIPATETPSAFHSLSLLESNRLVVSHTLAKSSIECHWAGTLRDVWRFLASTPIFQSMINSDPDR